MGRPEVGNIPSSFCSIVQKPKTQAVITCNKVLCSVCESSCGWAIVENAKIS